MPWTPDEFKKFKDGLSDKQAARAARIANAILKSCLSGGKSQAECERIAIATALKAVSEEGIMGGFEGELRFTDKPWDGDKSRFSVDQLLDAVPRAVAAWARKQAKDNGRDVIKSDLVLPYKEPDGTVNINGVRNALARLSQVKGVPKDVLADARSELQRVLDAYRKQTGKESAWVQSSVANSALGEKLEKYKMESGMLRIPLVLARAGVYVWERPKGEYRALEREEEVFSPDFMAQFEGLPITLDHPPGGTLEEDDLERYIVGWVGPDVYRSGDMLYGEGIIFSGRAVEAMRAGEFELSKGYWCDVREEPGEWKGQRYDVVHENIILDHVAIVPKGVCGVCRVLIESGEHCGCVGQGGVVSGQGGDMNQGETVRLVFKGKEFVLGDQESVKRFEQALEGTVQAYEAQAKELEAAKAELAKLAKELEAARSGKGEEEEGKVVAELEAQVAAYKAKCEAFEGELKAIKEGNALEALVQERKQLEDWAEKYVAGFDPNGKTNTDIRVALIQAIDKEFKADGRSECEIRARCEAMMKVLERVEGSGAIVVRKGNESGAGRLDILKDAIRGRSARLPENRKGGQQK